MAFKNAVEAWMDGTTVGPADFEVEGLELEHVANLYPDVRSVLSQLVPTGREIRSRNGGWYQVRMRPYRTVDDRIEGVVVSFADITERRQTEEALRESEQKLRQEKRLVELSGEPILVWEFDGGSILDWNRGCEELYGYRREEALGWNKEELLATEVDGSSFAEIKAKLLASRSWSGEVRHRSKDGREVIVESRIDLEEIPPAGPGDLRWMLTPRIMRSIKK